MIKNHESWLTGSSSFPEVNAMRYNNYYDHGHSRGYRRDHGRRQINFHNYNGHNSNKPSHNKEKREKKKNIHSKDTKKIENICYRCEINGH